MNIACAPVLISTVNRYQHFRDCLESLSRCTWADKTDVFVAVDYPPSENYWEGYRLIKGYLDTCGNLGFKSLNVIYRETNYFYTEKGNLGALLDEVSRNYDRYIITEDDNVFSPNFLVFINKGLDKYKEDKSILAINGYCHVFPVKYGINNYFKHDVYFSAWGFGTWKDQLKMAQNNCNISFFRKKALLPTSWYRLCKSSVGNLESFLRFLFSGKIAFTDSFLSIYMVLENKCVIMPVISKVRTCGFDGTGIHSLNSEIVTKLSNQAIDKDSWFDYMGSGDEFFKENHNLMIDNILEKETIVRLMGKIVNKVFRKIISR